MVKLWKTKFSDKHFIFTGKYRSKLQKKKTTEMTRFCHKMNVPKSPSKITRYHNNPLSKNPPICPEGFKWSLITYDQFCYYLTNYYLTLLVLCDIIYFCFWDDEYSNNLLEDNLRWPAPSPDGCWFFIIQITFLVNARKIFPFRGFSIYWRVLEIMKRFKIFSTYRFNLKLTSIKKHILTIFWAMVFFFQGSLFARKNILILSKKNQESRRDNKYYSLPKAYYTPLFCCFVSSTCRTNVIFDVKLMQ